MALNDTLVRQLKHKGASNGEKYADGGGLNLQVTATGKYWRQSYRFDGKQKTLALGVYPEVSLLVARQRRDEARKLLANGIDPSTAKRDEKQAQAAVAANTFEIVARQWLAITLKKRAAVTQAKITNWLVNDAFPYIGKLPISAIKPKDVLEVARRMEARGIHESAHRIVNICSQVFRYAVSIEAVPHDVTADLRGALAPIEKGHYPAITEPKEVAALLRSIYDYNGHPCGVAALKLSPLLFVRPGELRKAAWSEIDLEAAEWRIPSSKMKMKIEHLVPLSTQAVAILRELLPFSGHGNFVFPSIRTGERSMSENTINAALRGMGYPKEVMTAHGFRATARTIMDEVLGERVDLIEHQLAHLVKDPNGTAYNRTAHLPARRAMMQRWADYLDKLRNGADVIQLRTA